MTGRRSQLASYKVRPGDTKATKAWRALELQLKSESNSRYLSEQATLVRRVHALERQIGELLNRPLNPDRDRTTRELQSELEKLKARRP